MISWLVGVAYRKGKGWIVSLSSVENENRSRLWKKAVEMWAGCGEPALVRLYYAQRPVPSCPMPRHFLALSMAPTSFVMAPTSPSAVAMEN